MNDSQRSRLRAAADARAAQIMALYVGGATRKEIAELLDVSRERVRQIMRRAGIHGVNPVKNDKPLEVLQLAGQGYKQHEIALRLDIPLCAVRRVAKAMSLHFPRSRPRYTRGELVTILRRLALRLGHTPGGKEIEDADDTPSAMTFYHHFGSMRAAQIAAGLVPNQQGGGGQRHKPLPLSIFND